MSAEESPEPTLAQGDDGHAVLASPLARAVARLIDAVIQAVLGLGGLALIFEAVFCIWCATHNTDRGQVALGVLALAVWVLYEPVLVAWRGKTLGKAICGVKVVTITDGQPPNFGQSLGRWLIGLCAGCALMLPLALVSALIPSGPVAIAAILAMWAPLYLTSFLDSDHRRGWHDKAADTIVIASRRRTQPE